MSISEPKLRKVERDVLIPRYLEYKITHELCAKEAKDFAECSREAGFRVIWDCKGLMNILKDCSNKYWNDESVRKQVKDEYLAKRTKFRKTGEAEKSPFGRL